MAYFPILGIGRHFHDDDNSQLIGGYFRAYVAGTSTPTDTWTDVSGSVKNSVEVSLNARGEIASGGMFGDDGVAYKVVLHRSDDSEVWTKDNIIGVASGGGSGTIDGSGTIGRLPVFTASQTIGDSHLYQDGADLYLDEDSTFHADAMLGYFDLETTVGTTPENQGRVQWSSDDQTMLIHMGNDVYQSVGEEQYLPLAKNTTGVDNNSGEVVYITGAAGSRCTIGLASAADPVSSLAAIAVCTESVANNNTGRYTTFGRVSNFNTLAWAEGASLYLSDTPGVLTDVAPDKPSRCVFVGTVIRSHATLGSIFVKIHQTSYLTELCDVNIPSIIDGEIIAYNASEELYKPSGLIAVKTGDTLSLSHDVGGAASEFMSIDSANNIEMFGGISNNDIIFSYQAISRTPNTSVHPVGVVDLSSNSRSVIGYGTDGSGNSYAELKLQVDSVPTGIKAYASGNTTIDTNFNPAFDGTMSLGSSLLKWISGYITTLYSTVIRAISSAGVEIKNNSGTTIATMGASGGTGVTLPGLLTANGGISTAGVLQTSNTTMYTDGTGIIWQNGSGSSRAFAGWENSSDMIGFAAYNDNGTFRDWAFRVPRSSSGTILIGGTRAITVPGLLTASAGITQGAQALNVYGFAFGEIHFHEGLTAQSIPTGTTYTKVTAFTDDGWSENCTNDAANDKITITKTGVYDVDVTFFASSATTNVNFQGAIFLNGVEQNQIHSDQKLAIAGDKGSLGCSGRINVTSVPWDLDFRVRHDNGAAVNLTPTYGNISIERISDAK